PAQAAGAGRHRLAAPGPRPSREGQSVAARHAGAPAVQGRGHRPGRAHRPHPVGHAHPQPTLSRAGHRLTRQPFARSTQRQMAKSVGIPDREHSVPSSCITARRDDGRARPRIPSGPAVFSRPHKQAGYMTAPTASPKTLPNTLRNGGRPYMTGRDLLVAMLPKIKSDDLWRQEYEQFVEAVSFGTDEDRISFDKAVAACERLVATILG